MSLFFACRALRRWVVGCLLAALLLPTLQGCAGLPAPAEIRLAGIVVDGQRVAGPDEAGLARVLRGGAAIDARVGMVLYPGDRVEAGPRAHLAIHFPSGSELLMRPGSSGRLGSLFDTLGEVFAKVRGVFSIETEFVRAGARGTAFGVRSGPGGEFSVVVFEGRVQCASRTNAWPAVMLAAGEMAVAHPRPALVQQAPPTELQRTRAWVERVERLVPPPGSGAGAQNAALAVGIGALVVGILATRDGRGDSPRREPTPPAPQPPTPATLAAPLPVRPGEPGAARGGALDCRSPVEFVWRPVQQARDYIVTVEALPVPGRPGRPISSTASADLQTRIALGDGSFRWAVQARSGNTTGPSSAWWYFNCSTVIVR